ncbi:MBL fold metallo-hydrolase [Paraburkholderia unamae]|uniref:Glyoxylase-like metal-dependent hydrolase (Beta-lactamase superfamily II) n=1 Tax=Paraburkholderia unamae TaxID=219649 RepID=A0ABX5KSW6_9BURK|nr:MBL fold metallo-hydrolase [Paraburkholderia unamae]PVX84928.1 glyoxylase-like metal-dependent hydrolase (beta-lactamase superfamily II) [Paraburkholderia unamae]RAR65978.1 glyoxylase-like metal-dependent hydrolase (beta-lactamase superfamily II) [Paraburkholderia unamae]CAG9266671.1 MBL fold metallo-hydrolase [Paraburkholderia unamae]
MTTVSFASAADTRAQQARLVELADRVYGFVSDFDPNCGFIVGDDGVLVIDTRATPTLARELRDAIASVTDKPVKYVFLTHYHAVRVLGASVFDGATVISSAGTLDWIRTRGEADFASEAGRFPRLFQGIDEIPGLTYPHMVFEDTLTLWFGGREIQLRHFGAGHSFGDSVCWLPAERVLFSGDLVENRCGVYAGDGYLRAWSKTLAKLRALDADVLLPGRGAALNGRAQVEQAIDGTQRFVDTVLDCVGAAIARGASLKECYFQTLETMKPVFGDWPVFQHVLPFDVCRAFEELNGTEHPRIWTAERDVELWKLLHE